MSQLLCDQVTRYRFDLLDAEAGEPVGVELMALRQHVDSCVYCQQKLAATRRLLGLVGEVLRDQPSEAEVRLGDERLEATRDTFLAKIHRRVISAAQPRFEWPIIFPSFTFPRWSPLSAADLEQASVRPPEIVGSTDPHSMAEVEIVLGNEGSHLFVTLPEPAPAELDITVLLNNHPRINRRLRLTSGRGTILLPPASEIEGRCTIELHNEDAQSPEE